ncbi:hypothetical protein ACTUSN_22925 [Pantoea ananatis]|uniref:hypothetical protein n=1 Tax=Pantoea ananas TaxID=553 RepID=UPI003FA4404B
MEALSLCCFCLNTLLALLLCHAGRFCLSCGLSGGGSVISLWLACCSLTNQARCEPCLLTLFGFILQSVQTGLRYNFIKPGKARVLQLLVNLINTVLHILISQILERVSERTDIATAGTLLITIVGAACVLTTSSPALRISAIRLCCAASIVATQQRHG